MYGRPGGEPLEAFGVPLNRCYALVGLLRRRWRGWSGGGEVWGAVEEFFAQLRARAETMAPGKGESP